MPTTVAFVSDYGLADPFVGLCHLVLHRVAAPAPLTVVDLCHAVPAHDVRAGAVTLADARPWLPSGAVVLAVVDPGVGTDRAGIVVRSGSLKFVGPDNGLLWPAASVRAPQQTSQGASGPRAGGDATEPAVAAWRIPPPARDPDRGATFDGRDVFAPVAGRLAAGADPAALDLEPTGLDALVPLALPRAQIADGALTAEVVGVDGFGNVALAATATDLTASGLGDRAALVAESGAQRWPARRVAAFGDASPGELVVLLDSFGRVQLSVTQGRASDRLRLAPRAQVTLAAAEGGPWPHSASATPHE